MSSPTCLGRTFIGGLAAMSLGAAPARGGEVRMRAREHYEVLQIATPGGAAAYRGFTNTIVLWYEEPYRFACGIAGSPLFATLGASSPPQGFDDRIRLVHAGVEGKWFPLADGPSLSHGFLRLGGYNATLDTRGDAGRESGWSALAGLGFEFPIGVVGLAPEMDWRYGHLASGTRLHGIAPAVGVHFYKM